MGTVDPRTGSTHVIEPRSMCALVGTPAPRTESTHRSICVGTPDPIGLGVPISSICVGTPDPRTESTHL